MRLITVVAVPLVMFPLIVWMQVTFGYEVALFPLYMLPVAKISWEFGWRGAMIAVIAATCLWLVASMYMEQPFKYEWIRYYNAGVRGFLFAMTAGFLLLFKRVVEQHRLRMEAMRALLNVCHGCGAVQGSDGEWIAFDQLIVRTSRQSCECPRCSKLAEQAVRQPPRNSN